MKIPLQTFLTLDRLSQPVTTPTKESIIATRTILNKDGSQRIPQLWEFFVDPTRAPIQRQSHADGCSHPSFDAEGTLYFLSKQPTDSDLSKEFTQLWSQSPGEAAKPITNEALGVIDYRVSGQSIVLVTKVVGEGPLDEQRKTYVDKRNNGPTGKRYSLTPNRSWDHWIGEESPHFIHLDIQSLQRRDLCPSFRNELKVAQKLNWDLSPCGTQLAAVCKRPGLDRMEDSSLLIIDIQSGSHRHIGKQERMTHQEVRFSPDGSKLAATRHTRVLKKHGGITLCVYSLSDDSYQQIAPTWDALPNIMAWHGNHALILTAPTQGQTPIYRYDWKASQLTRITAEEQGGSHDSIGVSGNLLYGLRHTFAHPPELFVMSLCPQPIPQSSPQFISNISQLTTNVSLAVESLQCETQDGQMVQYFVLSNTDSKTKPSKGTVFWIHGGPVSSWVDGWHWRWNPLPILAEGYTIILPNPRGSTGFGQAFIEGVLGNQWGAACYQDILCIIDKVCKRPDIDATRLLCMGGSFGGYMCNWIATQCDRFVAFITHAGIYHFSAFQGTTDCPSYWAHDLGMHPTEDPHLYNQYSPHRFISQWKAPVLITHGEKDYRVPISEALMLFEDLQQGEIEATLLVFPDENHWIQRPKNAEQWYLEVLLFMSVHL